MVNIRYLARVASGVRLKKLKYAIDKVYEHSGQNRAFTFFDMLVCALRYGAGYFDYMMYGFYAMDHSHRKTYVTRVINKKIQSIMNDDAYSYLFDNKNEFNRRFAKYLRRETLDAQTMTREEFRSFLAGKEAVFAKGNKGSCGNEVDKLLAADFADVDAMYDFIKRKKYGVVEEAVRQHPDISHLYPHAVNTLRVVTDVFDNVPYCAYVIMKMGNNGKAVDNSGQGGIIVRVNVEESCIDTVATDDYTNIYERHPYTGVELKGYKLPFVKEAVELAKQAALEVEQIRHVGWDIGITPEGPLIIEGNDYPGTDLCQLAANTPEKIGLLPFYRQHIPGL